MEKFIIVSINRDIKEEEKVIDGKKVVYFIRANQVAQGRADQTDLHVAHRVQPVHQSTVDHLSGGIGDGKGAGQDARDRRAEAERLHHAAEGGGKVETVEISRGVHEHAG